MPSGRRTDHFVAKEVLARRNARRDGEGDLALVGDHAVNAPGLIRGLQAILVDLEPVKARHVGLGGVRNTGAVQGPSASKNFLERYLKSYR